MTREQAWAIVRLVFGIIQMIGATAGVTLLLRTGVDSLSVGAAVITGIVTLTSILLFRNREPKR